MINLDSYFLTPQESKSIQQILEPVGFNPSPEQIWQLVDQAWQECGCDNQYVDEDKYANFYGHPIWLLNGLFIEQHNISMEHRHAIAATVTQLKPNLIVDFGGGFGTLARLIATALPAAEIHICEPYPPRYGLESCRSYSNIQFTSSLLSENYDVLVSTDVLEHVPDPLALLAEMVQSVRLGGHLLIANCFYPVIKCHLPRTFHLRYSFDNFCQELGLERLGQCEGSHATLYQRSQIVEPNWLHLRQLEQQSQRRFAWHEWRSRHLSPWVYRTKLLISNPLYYPRKLLDHLMPTP